MTLGEKLSKLRREQNLTQEQLAEVLGVSRQAVSKWESGVAYPETEKLIRLAKLYDCSLDYLLLDKPREQSRAAVGNRINFGSFYVEKVSKRKIGNLPLWHINIGHGRVAKGVIAVGFASKGIISVGLASLGVVSFGVLSVGLMAMGVLSTGLVSLGAIAAGILALGSIAVGVFGIGSLAIGEFAVGAAAVGKYAACGDHASAAIAIGASEAKGSLFEMLTVSWSAWYEHGDTVKGLLEETVPWYLDGFKKLFLWFCQWI